MSIQKSQTGTAWRRWSDFPEHMQGKIETAIFAGVRFWRPIESEVAADLSAAEQAITAGGYSGKCEYANATEAASRTTKPVDAGPWWEKHFPDGDSGNATDTQVGGSHYTSMKIQPLEFIMANDLDYIQGNIIKYACRHKNKNGAEDLRKVGHYARLGLEIQYGESE